ncbi:MAG: cupin domain-containing protein [Ignavibacteriaceae bacterium]
MNRYLQYITNSLLLVLFSSIIVSFAQDKSSSKVLSVLSKELLNTQLDVWKDGQVIVNYIEAPAGYEMKRHYHPGEEIAYIIEGSGTTWFEDKPEVVVSKGDIIKIPFKAVHTFIPGPDGVKVLVFRLHKKGEPIRIIVE